VDAPDVLATIGWADLESGEPVRRDHRFAAYSVTKLLTVVAILRLVAEDRLRLDSAVSSVLSSFRLSSDEVTIRELLTHTAGVRSDFAHFVDAVPPAAELLGPVLEVDEATRGHHVYSNGGYATLGQVVADLTGRSYETFVVEEVLRPLAMASSGYPTVPPWPAPGVATGHDVDADGGRFVPTPPTICSVPPAGGLWTTADDLARFAFGWASLLPDELVAEALRPQADRGGGAIGLGFLLVGSGEELVWGHAGGGLGYQSSLLCRPADGLVAVGLTNRFVPVEPLAAVVLDSMAAADVG
jgi:CubicO group peptidase (beta-lactamase class C family)